ncbi:mCG1027124 [Mus musculus]|nr:mCG1027124 [Mus musculus]
MGKWTRRRHLRGTRHRSWIKAREHGFLVSASHWKSLRKAGLLKRRVEMSHRLRGICWVCICMLMGVYMCVGVHGALRIPIPFKAKF